MPTVHYPSTTFPGRPDLALDVPPGWEPAAPHVPGVVLAAVQQEAGPEDDGGSGGGAASPGTFRPSIVVSVAQVDSGHTPLVDLEALASDAVGRREGVAGEIVGRTISGITFFGRDISYVDDDAGTLLASTFFGFLRLDGGGLLRVTVIGTIGTADHRAQYAQVQQVINGLRVTPGRGMTPIVEAGDRA